MSATPVLRAGDRQVPEAPQLVNLALDSQPDLMRDSVSKKVIWIMIEEDP